MIAEPRRSHRPGFTLVELLVAMAVFSMVLAALMHALTQSQLVLSQTRAQLSQFTEASTAFQAMSRRITDATLSPYWDYEYADGDREKTPSAYVRTSDLHFLAGGTGPGYLSGAGVPLLNPPPQAFHGHHFQGVFFQAPFGFHDYRDFNMDGRDDWADFNLLLNGWGYYIEFGSDDTYRPAHIAATSAGANFVAERWRSRLMEMRIPASSGLFLDKSAAVAWQKSGTVHARPIAENVIALIISPQEEEEAADAMGRTPIGIAEFYSYDSRDSGNTVTHHNLPPLLRITMVALDEASANRLQLQLGPEITPDFGVVSADLFQDANNFDLDLDALEANLLAQNLSYRVFSTTIRLRNAKWSLPR